MTRDRTSGVDGERAPFAVSDFALLRRHLGVAVYATVLVVSGAAWAVGLVGRAPAVAAAVLLIGALLVELGKDLVRRGRKRLWRISRKLLISYLLIGVVPVISVGVLFLLLVYVATGQFISMFAWRQIGGLTVDVDVACQAVTDRLRSAVAAHADLDSVRDDELSNDYAQPLQALRGRFENLVAQAIVWNRDASDSWIPPGLDWANDVRAMRPRWLQVDQFHTELVVGRSGQLELMAARSTEVAEHTIYVEVSLPLDATSLAVLQHYVGLDLRILEPRAGGTELVTLASTRPIDQTNAGRLAALPVFGVLFVPKPLRWQDGQPAREGRMVVTQRSLLGLYRDLYTFQTENTFLIVSLLVLVLLALFVFETAALGLGASLARSITGSIEQLSQGTQRIEGGDFEHRIAVHSADQLGDLSRSFNRMAVSVANLVRESAERERLEEELRIGRRIQQSLLPVQLWSDDRFEIAAYSLPAREVGGDYYDLFELDDERVGLLIADVSGKGTEAAFYMAEVKGIMLALSHLHIDPHAVLCQANQILGQSLDRRTFVTMAYGVLHLRTSKFVCARAGHSPVLHLPFDSDQIGEHRPRGLALGIDRHGGFDKILEPRTIGLGRGDLMVMFTDGVLEMVDDLGNFYGQERLQAALLRHRTGSAEAVRDALVADFVGFARPGPTHDDATLVVLRAR